MHKGILFRCLLELGRWGCLLQTDERTLLNLDLVGGCMMGLNMDLCILCKRCLISIQTILLYDVPKRYSFFTFGERTRK